MTYKAYNFRIYPNKEQQSLINKTFGCSRLVYNKALSKWNKDYENGLKTNKKTLNADLTAMKKEIDFLTEVDSIALQSAVFDVHSAFNMFFKGVNRHPKFKKKYNGHQSYSTKTTNNNIALIEDRVKLPKLGLVKFAKSRNVNGNIISATIRRNPSGKYFISLLSNEKILPLGKTGNEVGIDLGLTHFAITTNTDMQKIENPQFIKKSEERLKKEQKILSRRMEVAKQNNIPLSEAKNYQKQKVKVAKIHEKIKNQRTDFLQRLSTEIVRNNDFIAIEDLNVSGMVKNHKLAKAIQNVSWGSFRVMLEHKCEWYEKELVVINRFYPSSQICSSCGVIDGKKALSVRTWTCSSCGENHDRDINAAHNILNQARNEYKNR